MSALIAFLENIILEFNQWLLLHPIKQDGNITTSFVYVLFVSFICHSRRIERVFENVHMLLCAMRTFGSLKVIFMLDARIVPGVSWFIRHFPFVLNM